MSLPPSGPPSEVANYSMDIHPRVLNQSIGTEPTSMSSSARLSSHGHSLFDNISGGSGHSYIHSSPAAEAPPPQAWIVPVSTSNSVLLTWLQKHPLVIPPSQLNFELSTNRYNKDWVNFENEFVISYWVGPSVPPNFVLTAMDSRKSPETTGQSMPEWETLSSHYFRGQRSPGTLVQH
ncbi:hypothetical protein FRC10_002647 [Ceratobasidium sp. 414]|nr:hypothetical protein FRC10_002647 [Ceratobasidium sp. 414]